MAVALGSVILLVLLTANYRRLCGCYCLGVGKRANQRANAGKVGAAANTAAGKDDGEGEGEAGEVDSLALSRRLAFSASPIKSKLKSFRHTSLLAPPKEDSTAVKCGRRIDAYKPMARQLIFLLLTLIYALVTNTVLSLLPPLACQTVPTSVSDYLNSGLDRDPGAATALRQLPAGLTLQKDLSSPCLDSEDTCLQPNPFFSVVIQVQVLRSSSSFVCNEGKHKSLLPLAWATLIVYTLAYPLFTWLWIRRRVAQVIKRGPLRKHYSLALYQDRERRQKWIRGGKNGLQKFWRAIRASLCGLGSRYQQPSAAVGDNSQQNVASWDSIAGVKHRGRSWRGMVTLWRPIKDFFSAVSIAPSVDRNGRVILPKQALAGPASPGANGSPYQAQALMMAKGSVRASLASPSTIRPRTSVAFPPGLSAARAGGPGMHAAKAHRSTSLLHLPPASTSTTKQADTKAVPLSLSSSPHDGESFLVMTENNIGVKSSSPRTARQTTVARPSLAITVTSTGSHVITANGLIDGNALITGDPSLAHFTGGDYRASRFWFRHEDMLLLLYLSMLGTYWPSSSSSSTDPSDTSGAAAGLLVLVLLSIVAETTSLVTFRPYTPESVWVLAVRLTALLLAALSAGLNFVVAVNPLAVTAANAAGGNTTVLDETVTIDAAERAPAVVTTAVACFTAAILLFIVLVVSFLLSMQRGAAREQQKIVADAKEAETQQEKKQSATEAVIASSSPLTAAGLRNKSGKQWFTEADAGDGTSNLESFAAKRQRRRSSANDNRRNTAFAPQGFSNPLQTRSIGSDNTALRQYQSKRALGVTGNGGASARQVSLRAFQQHRQLTQPNPLVLSPDDDEDDGSMQDDAGDEGAKRVAAASAGAAIAARRMSRLSAAARGPVEEAPGSPLSSQQRRISGATLASPLSSASSPSDHRRQSGVAASSLGARRTSFAPAASAQGQVHLEKHR
jgi:hypothetical protein